MRFVEALFCLGFSKKKKKRNGVQFCLTSFGTEKWSCGIKAVEMFIFFPPINVSNSD